jgi:signal peptidase I
VMIRCGDVYIDGKIARKDLTQQKALLLPVDDARYPPPGELPPRWSGQSPKSRWNCYGGRFTRREDEIDPAIDWLVYRHWRRQAGAVAVRIGPVEDVLSYNQNLPYREEDVHPVADLFLAFRVVETAGRGTLWIRAGNGRETVLVGIGPEEKKLHIYQNDHEIGTEELPGGSLAGVKIEVSLIDRQFLLALDGRVAFCRPFDSSGDPPPGTPEPFAVGTQSLEVVLDSFQIFRDVYYDSQALGSIQRRSKNVPSVLGDDEYFVLGDNTAVSEDSRSWAGERTLKTGMIIGKTLIAIGSDGTLWWGWLRSPFSSFTRIRRIR